LSTQRRSATKRRSSGKRSGRSVQPARGDQKASGAASTPSSTVATTAVTPEKLVAKPTAAKTPVSTGSASEASSTRKHVPADRRKPRRNEADQPKRRTLINTDRFEGVRRFSRDTMAEIKKVNWPDRETTRNLTLVVIAVSAVLGIMLGGIDFVLFQLFEALP